jgi:hypothetical protein
MLLGQIVAISFAQCLFYTAIDLYPTHHTASRSTNSRNSQETSGSDIATFRKMRRFAILALVTVPVILIPQVIDTSSFLWVLAIPHLALFIPPLVEPAFLERSIQSGGPKSVQECNKWLYRSIVAVACAIEIKTLVSALMDTSTHLHLHRHSAVYVNPLLGAEVTVQANSLHGIWTSLRDHPAVSSVGWDSILCILNYQSRQSFQSLYSFARTLPTSSGRSKHSSSPKTKF